MARLRSSLIALVATLAASSAKAEHCHHDAPSETPGKTMLAVRAEFASYAQRAYEGTYEGLALAASHEFDFFGVSAELPGYRLVRNGETVSGIGDASLALAIPFRFESKLLDVGFALHTSFPTGNAGKGLGMGHFMFMPGVWIHLGKGKLSFDSSVGGGFALMPDGSHASHASHGPRSIVNPMNGRELTFQMLPRFALSEELRVKLRMTGAYPLEASGAPRLVAGVGVEFPLTSFFSSLEVSTALVGDPYREKLSLGLGGSF